MAFLGNSVSLACAPLCSVLLQAGLVSPRLVQSLLPWLGSRSVNLRLTARAFFAEVRWRGEGRVQRGFTEILLLGMSFFVGRALEKGSLQWGGQGNAWLGPGPHGTACVIPALSERQDGKEPCVTQALEESLCNTWPQPAPRS